MSWTATPPWQTIVPPEPVPWCVPDLTGSETRYLTEAIAAGQAGPSGDFLTRFETGAARLAGARHAVATCTGTAALHITFLLAGVRPGDEVIVPAWTFVATANAVRHAGGHPVALDIDPRYWQLDPGQLERFLTRHCRKTRGHLVDTRTGRPVTAVAPVDLLGHPADLAAITALARAYQISVVEDAAQALGRHLPRASGGRKRTGSGQLQRQQAHHRRQRRRHLHQRRPHRPPRPLPHQPGPRPPSRIPARRARLELPDDQPARRRRLRPARTSHPPPHRQTADPARYTSGLSGIKGIRFQDEAHWATATRWLATIVLDPEVTRITGPQLRAALAQDGIQAGPPWTPLHQTGAHRNCAPWPCPVAGHLGRHALHLPSSPALTENQQNRVVAAVRAAIGQPART